MKYPREKSNQTAYNQGGTIKNIYVKKEAIKNQGADKYPDKKNMCIKG